MPTRNINLTAEQDAFVEEVVRAGKYQDASEAVRDAVRRLQQGLQVDELKLERNIRLVYPAKRGLSHAASAFLELIRGNAG